MKKEKSDRIENVFFIAGLICITSFAALTVFYDLIRFKDLILEWDEARHGISAYEMLQTKNYIVNTFQYSPDYWNVKPPFSMWIIILGYKIFGFNTLGLRFFSALCLPAAVSITMIILKKRVGIIAAMVSGFLLAVCGGRLPHLFTTGDPDALLFLFSLLTCLFLYSSLEGNRLYLGGGICAALAFLTKAMHVAGLFFFLVVFVAAALKKRVFSVKQISVNLMLPMAVPVILWAVLRFTYDGPEFFRHMFVLDVVNRVTSVVENHSGGVTFYFDVFRLFIGAPVMGVFVLLLLFWIYDRVCEKYINKNKNIPVLDVSFIAVFSAMAVGPFIIFTISATKLAWYIYPSLIGFCLIAGYAAQNTFSRLCMRKGGRPGVPYLCCLAVCLLYCLAVKPYQGPPAAYATNVNSVDSIFSTVENGSGLDYIAVNSKGKQINSLNSWLLQSYFWGMKYLPGGMEIFESKKPSLVALRYGGDAELNSFLAEYPDFEIIGRATEYTGAGWVLLE